MKRIKKDINSQRFTVIHIAKSREKPTAQTKTCQRVCLSQRADRQSGTRKYWLQQSV